MSSSSSAPDAQAAGEAAIQDIVRRLEEGWNAKDGAAFAAPFAGDADYVVVSGTYLQGRPSIASGHQEIFDTIYRDSHISLHLERLRFLRPDVAIAHVQAHLVVNRGGTSQESHARITLVLSQDDGQWQIAAFQNTPILARPG